MTNVTDAMDEAIEGAIEDGTRVEDQAARLREVMLGPTPTDADVPEEAPTQNATAIATADLERRYRAITGRPDLVWHGFPMREAQYVTLDDPGTPLDRAGWDRQRRTTEFNRHMAEAERIVEMLDDALEQDDMAPQQIRTQAAVAELHRALATTYYDPSYRDDD